MLMERVPGRFSWELGLSLERQCPGDLFLWFLASVLYGTRISGTIVRRTFQEFVRRRITTPEKVRETGWDGLVEVLDAGGYARYDFKTATKLLDVMRRLQEQYQGDLRLVHRLATDKRDLERRLRALGKGIGELSVQIFLRELRDIWPKADPALSFLAVLAAEHLRLVETEAPSPASVGDLRGLWRRARCPGKTFADFEAALVRLGRDHCRRNRWQGCPMEEFCGGRTCA